MPQAQPVAQAQPVPQALQHAQALPPSTEADLASNGWNTTLDQAAGALPSRATVDPAMPTRTPQPSGGFTSQAAGLSADVLDAADDTAQHPEFQSDSDTKAPRPPRRRRPSTTPSWSTPYAPQEQKL